eukprot:6205210-Pleurochrysis_carterae.AAC.1
MEDLGACRGWATSASGPNAPPTALPGKGRRARPCSGRGSFMEATIAVPTDQAQVSLTKRRRPGATCAKHANNEFATHPNCSKRRR